MSKDTFKICPWCKKNDMLAVYCTFSSDNCYGEEYFAVECDRCEVRGPERETRKEALEAWNSRKGE